MSQYPPGENPYGQYPQGQYPAQYVPGYAASPVSPRPTSVTVLAIIGIILGGLATLCTPFAVIPFLMEFPGPKNPVIEAMKEDTTLMGWTIASTLLGWVMAVVLLAASIGALKLKKWARQALVAYALIAVVVNVLSLVFTLAVVNPKLAELIGTDPASRSAMGMQTVTTVISSVVGLILPGFLLFYMTRPHVKAAFAGTALPAPAGGYPSAGGYGGYPPGGGYPQQ